MEIEKTLTVSAPRESVWALLMDPHVMTGAVPGMQSIDVISPTEYVALMKVKISFISAKFKLHTYIVEQRESEYLRAEGTGEDASVASSLKQITEVFLSDGENGGTELRLKVNVDLFGRLGTFGLSVMRTKADRMWDEFAKTLTTQIEEKQEGSMPAAETASSPDLAQSAPAPTSDEKGDDLEVTSQLPSAQSATPSQARRSSPQVLSATLNGQGAHDEEQPRSWLSRLIGGSRSVPRSAGSAGSVIRVEIRQVDKTVCVEWPVEAAGQCQEWLREVLAGQN